MILEAAREMAASGEDWSEWESTVAHGLVTAHMGIAAVSRAAD